MMRKARPPPFTACSKRTESLPWSSIRTRFPRWNSRFACRGPKLKKRSGCWKKLAPPGRKPPRKRNEQRKTVSEVLARRPAHRRKPYPSQQAGILIPTARCGGLGRVGLHSADGQLGLPEFRREIGLWSK